MESKTWEAVTPNAPSYEEAMKCAITPPAQMHWYPDAMMQQYQPQLVQPGQNMQPKTQSNFTSHEPLNLDFL